jgi:protein-disulfide isomerase
MASVIFGIPNSLLGLIFFSIVILYTIYTIYAKKTAKLLFVFCVLMCIGASVFALSLVIYQFYTEQFCPLCLVNAICAWIASFLFITGKIIPKIDDANQMAHFTTAILILGLAGFVGIGSFYNAKGGSNNPITELKGEEKDLKRIVNLDNFPFKGSDSASLVIVEFANPTCPYCKILHNDSIQPLLKKYNDRVKYYYYYAYSHCANSEDFFAILEGCRKLNKFFECIDLLYNNQEVYYTQDMKTYSCSIDFVKLKSILSSVQIGGEKFDEIYKGIDREELGKSVRSTMDLLEIQATPTLVFLRGNKTYKLVGYRSLSDLEAVITKLLQ